MVISSASSTHSLPHLPSGVLQLHVAVSLGLDRHVEGLLESFNSTERNDRRE